MINEMQKYWFRAKRYGWGWAEPLTWQGWLSYLGYVAVLIYSFRTVDVRSHSGSDTVLGMTPIFIITTLVLLALCYTKGEPARWRWGGK